MHRRGPYLVLLSSVLFATGGLFFKIIPWNAMAINAARSVLAGLVLLAFMLLTRHKFRINRDVILAAVGICATNNLYALANKLTTAGNAIVLQFSMPVFVILIMAFVFRKKPTLTEVIVCITVLGGVVLFFVDSLNAGGMLGNALALISGFFYACFFIFNSREDSDPFTATLMAYGLSALIGLPWLVTTDFAEAPEGYSVLAVFAAVLALGFIQQGCAQLSFSAGIKETPAVTAALFSGLEPVLNPILVAVFWGEKLTPLSLLGAGIVLVSIVTYNILAGRNS